MIWESSYWKNELLKIAKRMSRRINQRRWLELSAVNVEKDVFLAFYIIRKLVEAKKLTTEAENLPVKLNVYPTLGRAVTRNNWRKIDELYNFSKQTTVRKGLQFICNQIIHSYVFFISIDDETGGLAGVLFCSDHERNRHLYELSTKTMIDILERIGNNEISTIHSNYDDKSGDWKIYAK